MISAGTTVARLLEEYPALLEFLASYHPHFEKLRDPVLRERMAPRVTVAEAARIAGVDAELLLGALRRAAGEDTSPARPPATAPPRAPGPPPDALVDVPETALRRLDVRDAIGRGEEPFATIMSAVREIPDGGALVLRVPFEPVPLYDVLARRGFAHWIERSAAGDVVVWFHRASSAPPPAVAPSPVPRKTTVDVRGLEPPQPMVSVLEQLDRLGPGEQLEVIHDRRPMLLYPQLEERGFTHSTEEPEPGLVRILITRGRG